MEEEMKYYKDHTNPKYTGPGSWNAIHTIAYHARTLKEQQEAINVITNICIYFPCETCRKHAIDYIKENPMEVYLMTKYKEDNGIFVWTWKFHNAVNYRIGKHIMSMDLANHLYDTKKTNKICSKDCSGEEPTRKTNKKLKSGTLYLESKSKG
jgi:hypothetical protein